MLATGPAVLWLVGGEGTGLVGEASQGDVAPAAAPAVVPAALHDPGSAPPSTDAAPDAA